MEELPSENHGIFLFIDMWVVILLDQQISAPPTIFEGEDARACVRLYQDGNHDDITIFANQSLILLYG